MLAPIARGERTYAWNRPSLRMPHTAVAGSLISRRRSLPIATQARQQHLDSWPLKCGWGHGVFLEWDLTRRTV
jgi:hypothetical protein